jgi:replicative DNA helicase
MDPEWRNQPDGLGAAPPIADHPAWSSPVPFDQFDLPPFPSYALPQPLRAFVEAVAPATQTPADLAGMLALSVVAATSAKKVIVALKEGWVGPLNIFTATALPPGNRKSAVFAAIVNPIEEYERQESRTAGKEVEKNRSAMRIKEARLKSLEQRAGTAKEKELCSIVSETQTLAAELAETDVGSATRLLADDCTPEKLCTLLREQRGRIAIMSPEGDVLI